MDLYLARRTNFGPINGIFRYKTPPNQTELILSTHQYGCCQSTIYLISTKIIIAASLRSAVENRKVEAERRLAAIIIFVDSSGHRPRACNGSNQYGATAAVIGKAGMLL